jgi:hypothetical protein
MENPVKILVLNSQIEASLIDEILNDRKIPHILRSYHDLAYDGLWATQTVWGQLDAPPEYKEEILEIYEMMSKQ